MCCGNSGVMKKPCTLPGDKKEAGDAPRRGIEQNLRSVVPKPSNDIGRAAVRYMLFALPPLMGLLFVLFVHLYPLILLCEHGPGMVAKIVFEVQLILGRQLASIVLATIISAIMVVFAVHLLPREAEQKEFAPYTEKRKVCVIGAGIGGILSAKQCLEEGLDVTVLEKATECGGVWRSRAWEKTMLTSSNMNTSFSDFIFPEVFPDNEHIGFATRDQWVHYLDSYVSHFDLKRHMHFGCEVLSVVEGKDPERTGYVVTWTTVDGVGNTSTCSDVFHAVAVCTGLPNRPRPCPIKDVAKFSGSITHSMSYRDAAPFAGQRVLVVGTGESASDIVKEVAEVSSGPVAISCHSPTILLDREHYHAPPDYIENRLLFNCSAAARFCYATFIYLQVVFFGRWTTSLRRMPSASSFLPFLLYKPPLHALLRNPTAIMSSAHVTKSGCMLLPLDEGKAVACPAAVRFIGGKTVEFEDGSTLEVDAVVLANGYCPQHFPFLAALGLQHSRDKERYHLTFPPSHGGIAFVGFSRGQVGALTTLIEMQARWLALVVSGRRRLPSKEAMTARVERVEAVARGKYASRASWFAANYLARHEVLCAPDLGAWVWRDPLLVWRICTSSFASWQFRLSGPGAQAELVAAAYRSVQLRPDVPGLTVHQGVLMLLAVTSHFWWRVLRALPLPAWVDRLLNGLFMPNTEEIF